MHFRFIMVYGAPKRLPLPWLVPVQKCIAINSPNECMFDFHRTLIGMWERSYDFGSQKNGKSGAFALTGEKEKFCKRKVSLFLQTDILLFPRVAFLFVQSGHHWHFPGVLLSSLSILITGVSSWSHKRKRVFKSSQANV